MNIASVTAAQIGRVMLAAQGLDRPLRRRADRQAVLDVIRRMSALQIDTIHVVARSPYIVLWSRLGDYRPEWLEQHLAEGRLFEYWSHEASFLPIEDYGLYRHRMIDPGSMGWKYSHAWIEQHGEVIEHVLERVRSNGHVRSADFERKQGKGGGWWSWKPEKRALEMLFTSGDLMVARRQRFQRVYDLRERVLPGWTDAQLRPAEDADRELVLKAAQALGLATERWLGDYFRMPRKSVAAAVKWLAANGALRELRVDGWKEPVYAHPASAELIERARAGTLRATLTTILSPFDPLVWDRARARQVFDFDYRLECYTPAPKRQYGYFVLPILHRGRFVGRMDAKAHRKAGRFEVISLHIEEHIEPDARMTADVAQAIARFAEWHETPDVFVRATTPRAFQRELKRALAS